MKKKTSFLILGFILFSSVIIVFILFLNASEKANHQHTGFLREFRLKSVQQSGHLDLKYNSYYIAGATSKKVYFGNRITVRHLLICDINLTDTQHVELNIDGIERLSFRTVQVKVDSPYFYFADGTVPAIFRGTLENWRASRYTYDSAYFMELTSIGSTSFAITTTNFQTKEFTLGKEMNVAPHVTLAPGLLEKQIDGRFCVDGKMHYSEDLNWLVYVYYYRNQFICADSNLNLVYRGNTIDTISQAKIKIANIKSQNSATMLAPSLMVNKNSCVAGSRLFINSNLLAKNEDIDVFENSQVIDVYELRNGQYRSSFYLPKFKGSKLRDFKIFDDVLIALYDHWVVKFQLYLPEFTDQAI